MNPAEFLKIGVRNSSIRSGWMQIGYHDKDAGMSVFSPVVNEEAVTRFFSHQMLGEASRYSSDRLSQGMPLELKASKFLNHALILQEFKGFESHARDNVFKHPTQSLSIQEGIIFKGSDVMLPYGVEFFLLESGPIQEVYPRNIVIGQMVRGLGLSIGQRYLLELLSDGEVYHLQETIISVHKERWELFKGILPGGAIPNSPKELADILSRLFWRKNNHLGKIVSHDSLLHSSSLASGFAEPRPVLSFSWTCDQPFFSIRYFQDNVSGFPIIDEMSSLIDSILLDTAEEKKIIDSDTNSGALLRAAVQSQSAFQDIHLSINN